MQACLESIELFELGSVPMHCIHRFIEPTPQSDLTQRVCMKPRAIHY